MSIIVQGDGPRRERANALNGGSYQAQVLECVTAAARWEKSGGRYYLLVTGFGAQNAASRQAGTAYRAGCGQW